MGYKILIKIKTPEKFKDNKHIHNDNGYLNFRNERDVFWNVYDDEIPVFNILKDIVNDKALALLNLNRFDNYYLFRFIARSIIFDDCEYEIKEI